MRCPVCEDQQLAISSREGVEIDYCPQCRGVWLDRGELDKILDRAVVTAPAAPPAPPAAVAPPPPQPDRASDRGGDKRRKRRSFLDDLFDFD